MVDSTEITEMGSNEMYCPCFMSMVAYRSRPELLSLDL